MPRADRPLPSALARAPFAVSEAERRGITEDALRRLRLRVPTPGVRSTRSAPAASDVRARCAEIVPVLPQDAVFSHVTALALFDVDLPSGVDAEGELHVQVGPRTSLPRRRGVVGHRRSRPLAPVFVLPGDVRVVPPEVAWTQIAGDVVPRELVVAADALLRRRSPACSRDDLLRVVRALPSGTRGARRLRAALDQARPGTDSCMETRLRLVLVDGGLPCPEVNLPVRGGDGGVVAMPDLSYPDARLAIEYDGDVHRTDRRTWRRDIRRRQDLEALGWRVITCTADDVLRHPDRPVTWVRRALTRHAASR